MNALLIFTTNYPVNIRNYFENCDNYIKGKLPTIIFEMESNKGKFNLNLEPEDYLNKYIDNETQVCNMGIIPDDVEHDIITLGQEVMKAFTTFYNFGSKKIGWYNKYNDRHKRLKSIKNKNENN